MGHSSHIVSKQCVSDGLVESFTQVRLFSTYLRVVLLKNLFTSLCLSVSICLSVSHSFSVTAQYSFRCPGKWHSPQLQSTAWWAEPQSAVTWWDPEGRLFTRPSESGGLPWSLLNRWHTLWCAAADKLAIWRTNVKNNFFLNKWKQTEMQVMTSSSGRCIKTKHNKTMGIKTITYLETIFYPWSLVTAGGGTDTGVV